MSASAGFRRCLAATAATLVAVLVGISPVVAATGGTGKPIGWRIVTLPPAVGGHPASFGEPGIAIGSGGLLVIDAARANAGYPTWWVSRDGGRDWGPGRDYDLSGAMTGDADAAIGADGRLYILNLAFNSPPQEPINPTVLVYSSASGVEWQGPSSFPPPHGADQPDRPWLVPDPYHPNRVYVTNSEGVGDVVIWASHDYGRSFSGPVLITGAAHAASIELTSRPLFDPADHDRIFLLYESSAVPVPSPEDVGEPLSDFPLTQLWLAESPDAGRTWSNRLVLDIGTLFGPGASGGSLGHVLPALAIDRAGNLYAAFSLRLGDSTQTHVFLIHSGDHGIGWSAPVQVDRPPFLSNVMPALAAGSAGRVDLSWYASRSPSFTDPSARWVEMFAQTTDALSPHPVFTSTQVFGLAHIGGVDSSGNPGSQFYDWGLRDFQSLAVDACGMAHLAWTDDVGPGSTITASQASGTSVLARPQPGCNRDP